MTKSTRFHERTQLEIPLQVHYVENAEIQWTENTQTKDVTICGAGFKLSHPVEPKRLIRLSLPMPRKFRLFDHGQDQYVVWALVRYVRLIQANASDEIRTMVGVAFTGDSPPQSFTQDPKTVYDLKPILRKQNLWDLRELPRNTGSYVRSAEERFPINIKISVQIVSETGKIIETVEAETLNISESGMAAVTKFESIAPRFVLVKTEDESVVLLAAVRGIHKLDSADSVRLHMEFVSGSWRFD